MASYEEFEDIALNLERWHGLFSQFWSMGRPRFTRKIPTAAVAFNRKGQFTEFLFNPDFWDQLSDEAREFIICHECLHVLREHGFRGINAEQKAISNIAADVVVNETLVNNFGFNYDDLDCEVTFTPPKEQGGIKVDPDAEPITKPLNEVLVRKDTTFPEPDTIDDGETFEYYYRKIMEVVDEMIQNGQISTDGNGIPVRMPGGSSPIDQDTIDSHEFLPDGQGAPDDSGDEDEQGQGQGKDEIDGQPDEGLDDIEPMSEGIVDDIVDNIRRELNPDENSQMTKAGVGRGDKVYKARLKAMQATQKWEDLVKVWTAMGDAPDDLWTRKNRRHFMLPPDFILPAEQEDDKAGGKVNVWFFQDISGSCTSYLDHFYSAARTFPEHFFKLRMFGFDTGVIEVDPKNPNLRAGGGTCFKCIETAIQAQIKATGCGYPDAVFVFTDGCGTQVSPQYPDRWHWFLEGNWQDESCIPSQSKKYQLGDFVKDNV